MLTRALRVSAGGLFSKSTKNLPMPCSYHIDVSSEIALEIEQRAREDLYKKRNIVLFNAVAEMKSKVFLDEQGHMHMNIVVEDQALAKVLAENTTSNCTIRYSINNEKKPAIESRASWVRHS